VAPSERIHFIGLAAGQVVYGPLLDRFGRKPPLAVSLTLFIIASIRCAFAPDVYQREVLSSGISPVGVCPRRARRMKHEAAMRRPWLPVEPDPPWPEP
jgi:MFS family permease